MPPGANHVELREFLRDKLSKNIDVLAFEVAKPSGRPYAFLTVSDVAKGNLFLQAYGSLVGGLALTALTFRGRLLTIRRGKGVPDALMISALQDKEESLRAKRMSRVPFSQRAQGAQPTLSFTTLMTGVWEYDHQETLMFDQKFKDVRAGWVTFGRRALML